MSAPLPANKPFKFSFVVNALDHADDGTNTYLAEITRYGVVDGIMNFWQFQRVRGLPGTYQECLALAIPVNRIVSIVCTRVEV